MTTRARSSLLDTLKTLLFAVILALTVRVGIAQAYEVEGPSMEPNIVQGDRLVVLRAAYGLSLPGIDDSLVQWAQPEIGDVVIVESPTDGLDLVKRVIGLPGDVIAIDAGVIVRNGTPLARGDRGACDPARHLEPDPRCRVREERSGERTWITSGADDPWGRMDPITVPAGAVFVVGDHRDRSNDSRSFGSVPMSRLRGRVLF